MRLAETETMGFPTPFPEPESPELQRFAVRSPSEIVSRLHAMQKAAVPLNVFVGADASFRVVTLRRVDQAAGQLVFAGTEFSGAREQQVGARLTTFVGYDDSCKLQFAVYPAAGSGGQAFTTPIPEQLLLLQRRSAARMSVHGGKAAVCRIRVPGAAGGWEALRVFNISAGGIAVLAYPERFESIVGQQIDDCRLDLPGVGGAVVSVRVRHLGPAVGARLPHCCGCAFVDLTQPISSMIERFLESLDSADMLGN